MTTLQLILSAIVAVFGLAYALWKRYGTNEAKVNEWLEEIEKLRNEENEALPAHKYALYDKLVKRRVRLSKRVGRYTDSKHR